MPIIDSAAALLTLHEGVRLQVYDDKTGLPLRPGMTLKGHPTIGIGRALDVRGIDAGEAQAMLMHDLAAHTTALREQFPWYEPIGPVRQAVLQGMAHANGIRGLRGFRKMIAACAESDWERAALEILDSDFARQTGARATRLSEMMRSGKWPTVDAPGSTQSG